jgi:hypothetical protein
MPLSLIKHHIMKTYGGSGDTVPYILNFGATWSEWPTSGANNEIGLIIDL